MAEYTLVLLEVSGIQDYIFGSNQLAQNLGASELVARAASEWVVEELKGQKLKINAKWDEAKGLQYTGDALTTNGIAAEVIYEGGGNCMLLFAGDQQAETFIKSLTRKTIKEAPGLNLVAIREKFDWNNKPLADLHSILRAKLGERKLDRPYSAPLPGLGVTAKCVFTGLPAIGRDDDPEIVGKAYARRANRYREGGKLISAEVAAKLKAEPQAKNRLESIFPHIKEKGFEFAYNFNDFGTKGESSYIAVIHTDGNGMGERFKRIAKEHGSPDQNYAYVQDLRALSESVKENAEKALRETVECLLDSLDSENKFGGVVPLRTQKYGRDVVKLLPFRPIVFGGDDVTFVSEGRLGLALTAKYLQVFTDAPLADDKPAFARAGVAVVKSHYPFSRAYQLSEALAANAKSKIDDLKRGEEESATVMDWHFSTTGAIYKLAEIREREYSSSNDHSLLMRPILLSNPGSPEATWRTWNIFKQVMYEFQREDEKGQWVGRRNKIKALRDALRDGPQAVKLFLKNYSLSELPDIPGHPEMKEMKKKGWEDEKCGYFDAIEALDFYVSLDKKPGIKKEER